jgi:cobalt/nickel transport system permease protein
MLGLSAAFVFAAQMLNFPIAGGTSGHIVGGVLAAVLLGPSAAVIVLTCVLIVQCLMFADGGLTCLGANIFNMGIVNVCGGYFVFGLARRLIRIEETRATVFAASFAAWCGTVFASISCAGELSLSRTAPWSLAFPAMANVHMLIGIGEAVVTGLVIMAVLRTRPELVYAHNEKPAGLRASYLGYALLLCAGLALFVAPFASSLPDGLESVARQLGFQTQAASGVQAPLADYRLPLIGSPIAATAVAGLIGTAVAFLTAYALSTIVVPAFARKKNAPPAN